MALHDKLGLLDIELAITWKVRPIERSGVSCFRVTLKKWHFFFTDAYI